MKENLNSLYWGSMAWKLYKTQRLCPKIRVADSSIIVKGSRPFLFFPSPYSASQLFFLFFPLTSVWESRRCGIMLTNCWEDLIFRNLPELTRKLPGNRKCSCKTIPPGIATTCEASGKVSGSGEEANNGEAACLLCAFPPSVQVW